MFEHGISATWLRRAQWAIYVFFGLFALVSLGYVFYAAAHRQVFAALAGAGVVWGSIGLGIGMHCVTQMAAVVDSNMRALNELRKRADAIEQLLEQCTPLANLSRMGAGDPSGLVAARTESDVYPRIVPEPAGHAIGEDEGNGGHEASAKLVTDRDRADGESLRQSFREAVFSGDIELALAIGEDILEQYPRSAMAEQFRELRGPLHRRALMADRAVQTSLS